MEDKQYEVEYMKRRLIDLNASLFQSERNGFEAMSVHYRDEIGYLKHKLSMIERKEKGFYE